MPAQSTVPNTDLHLHGSARGEGDITFGYLANKFSKAKTTFSHYGVRTTELNHWIQAALLEWYLVEAWNSTTIKFPAGFWHHITSPVDVNELCLPSSRDEGDISLSFPASRINTLSAIKTVSRRWAMTSTYIMSHVVECNLFHGPLRRWKALSKKTKDQLVFHYCMVFH